MGHNLKTPALNLLCPVSPLPYEVNIHLSILQTTVLVTWLKTLQAASSE